MADKGQLWPTTHGEHNVGELTIAKIEERGEKVRWLTIDGYKHPLKAWKDDIKDVGEGQKIQGTIEIKDNTYNGNTTLEAWFKPPKAKRGGGGGGRGYTPKTPAEIHSPSIAGIIKSAMEVGGDKWKGLAEDGLTLYLDTIKKVGGAAS